MYCWPTPFLLSRIAVIKFLLYALSLSTLEQPHTSHPLIFNLLLINLFWFRRSCIKRGAICDMRPHNCCNNSLCKCNLWGTNCRCQRMGLFQRWGRKWAHTGIDSNLIMFVVLIPTFLINLLSSKTCTFFFSLYFSRSLPFNFN